LLTTKLDHNGTRRGPIPADAPVAQSQAMDGTGHPERILQAGVRQQLRFHRGHKDGDHLAAVGALGTLATAGVAAWAKRQVTQLSGAGQRGTAVIRRPLAPRLTRGAPPPAIVRSAA
jgi:ABC-type cobalamin/Fe3+-siderophores transport system ATPase subunit